MADYKLSKTDGGSIDPTKAKTWMKKYKDKHKDGVHAYFFGRQWRQSTNAQC